MLLNIYDTNPLVIFEALASGILILCSNRAANSVDFIIDGKNGYIADPYNIDEIVSKAISILECANRKGVKIFSREVVKKANYSDSAKAFAEYPFTALSSELPNHAYYAVRSSLQLLGLDIACDEQSFYLLEFQFVSFGTYTLEGSEWYFKRDSAGKWGRVDETSIVEKEFAISVYDFMNKEISNED